MHFQWNCPQLNATRQHSCSQHWQSWHIYICHDMASQGHNQWTSIKSNPLHCFWRNHIEKLRNDIKKCKFIIAVKSLRVYIRVQEVANQHLSNIRHHTCSFIFQNLRSLLSSSLIPHLNNPKLHISSTLRWVDTLLQIKFLVTKSNVWFFLFAELGLVVNYLKNYISNYLCGISRTHY